MPLSKKQEIVAKRKQTVQRMSKNLFDYGYFHGEGSNYPKEGYETLLWTRWFAETLTNFILSIKKGNVRLLDVGCAYGYLVKTAYENGIDAFGIDISEYAIAQGKRLNRCIATRLFVDSAEKVTERFGLATFDVITAIEVVEHLKNPTEALINFYKALKNEGFLILTSPSPELDRIFPDATHISVKSSSEWERDLRTIGFSVFAPFYFGSVLKQGIYVPKNLQKVLDSNLFLFVCWRKLYATMRALKARTPLPLHILAIKH